MEFVMNDEAVTSQTGADNPPPEEMKSTNGGAGEAVPAQPAGKIIKPAGGIIKPAGGIAKPKKGGLLDKFKSKHAAAIANVETLQGQLPHYPIAQARDFVRLHPDEENYCSPELCFVDVPIKGQSKDLLHLIDEDLALQFLPSGKIKRFRLALATKPYDVFFLAHIPSQNLDNTWNISVLEAAEQGRHMWVQVTSRKAEGAESYKIDQARDPDAFPDPKWPRQSLEEIIETTFHDRMIDHDQHPALLRLIGAKQSIK
jgi:hypothetical protein